jgi:hypothetical protein
MIFLVSLFLVSDSFDVRYSVRHLK